MTNFKFWLTLTAIVLTFALIIVGMTCILNFIL